MSATPIIAYGTTLTVTDGASNAPQAFTNPFKITIPGGDVADIETSSMASSSTDRTFMSGWRDSGNMSFEQIYCHADYLRLVALRGVTKTWVIVVPTDGVATTTYTVTGYLKKADVELDNEARVNTKVEVRISGSITVA